MVGRGDSSSVGSNKISGTVTTEVIGNIYQYSDIQAKRFDELIDLIKEARSVAQEEGIRRPNIILGSGWSWILSDEVSLPFLRSAAKAGDISLVRDYDE